MKEVSSGFTVLANRYERFLSFLKRYVMARDVLACFPAISRGLPLRTCEVQRAGRCADRPFFFGVPITVPFDAGRAPCLHANGVRARHSNGLCLGRQSNKPTLS